MISTRPLLLLASLLGTPYSYADTLGTYGRTYQIKERDAIASMKDAVRKKLANGGKEAMIKGAQDRYLASLSNIVTPKGIGPTRSASVHLVDLTEVIKTSIKDDKGNVVVPAGMSINPLRIKPLTKKLFFIDAKDDRQLQLVKQRSAGNDKIILLGGSVFRAGEVLKRKVYMDITGLYGRMQIHGLPSIVSQDGEKLKVEEVVF
jgi:conjugal transfer pilus assembly protein TraW